MQAATEASGSEPAQWSAHEWLRQLHRREISSRELTEWCIERLVAADRRLHALSQLDPDRALRDADEADRRRRTGDGGALLGLPLTVKDNLDVAGYPTPAGSTGVHPVASADASTVGRLRAAGAVVVAKTALPECASSYETVSAVTGRTSNPVDARRTAGGSSGGEAALLGADASIAGIGTDGGGSIRVPSHFCGIVGIRPTAGRTPETGQQPPTRWSGMDDLSCVGPMARSVEDLRLLLGVMAGADGVDPFAPPVPVDLAPSGRQPRVGFFDLDPAAPHTTAGTRRVSRAAAEALAASGCHVEEIEPFGHPEATDLFFAAVGADGGAHLRGHVARSDGRHDPQFRELMARLTADPPSAEAVFATRRRLHALRTAVRARLRGLDAVVCPVVAGPAPLHGVPPAAQAGALLDYSAYHYVHVVALAGLPSVAVPAGSEDGLPVGVQVVAAPWRDGAALDVAARLERLLGGVGITRSLVAAGARS
jgi:Asp-tRNA(Asn)/Glu-tRNA(Gln) amidotransferase A subunit family amidase